MLSEKVLPFALIVTGHRGQSHEHVACEPAIKLCHSQDVLDVRYITTHGEYGFTLNL